jgi:ubiquinone/menaquinone biosynthesis C-methylase UbiE
MVYYETEHILRAAADRGQVMSENAKFAQAVEITTAAYDEMAGYYAEHHEEMSEHWSERMEQFVELLAEAEEKRPIPELGRPGDDATLEQYLQFIPVLDAGCGPGRDARALAGNGLPVLGADISQGMLDEAIERTPRRLPTGYIRYAIMDMRRLALPDASCRGVWCSASLLHIPRRTVHRAMAELARVLRRGGPLVIFLKRQESQMAEEFQPYQQSETGARRFFAFYTEDEARELVATAGLEVLDLATTPNHDNPLAPHWISLLARKPWSTHPE